MQGAAFSPLFFSLLLSPLPLRMRVVRMGERSRIYNEGDERKGEGGDAPLFLFFLSLFFMIE